jgi:dihydrofolate reductase
MTVRIIVACDDHYGIGRNGTIPWPKNKEDMRWFKESTDGQIVVMGAATWADPLMPKPLPNRYNIVITTAEEVESKEQPNLIMGIESLKKFTKETEKDVWIIGGARLIEAALKMEIVDEVWMSRINGHYGCDTFVNFELIKHSFTLYETALKPLEIQKYKK